MFTVLPSARKSQVGIRSHAAGQSRPDAEKSSIGESMAFREAEIIDHLRFKQSLAESDCNAILKTGENSFSALPVYIRKVNDGEQFLVEIEANFYEAEKLPNFS